VGGGVAECCGDGELALTRPADQCAAAAGVDAQCGGDAVLGLQLGWEVDHQQVSQRESWAHAMHPLRGCRSSVFAVVAKCLSCMRGVSGGPATDMVLT
jgi:hypothetical protein